VHSYFKNHHLENIQTIVLVTDTLPFDKENEFDNIVLKRMLGEILVAVSAILYGTFIIIGIRN
jgi:hypothetical protein